LSDAGGVASGDETLNLAPVDFVRQMKEFEHVLVDLKELLYEGSWDRITTDLRNARDHKPHVYRLSHAIERDLKAIERLKAFEEKHNVSLAQVLAETRA